MYFKDKDGGIIFLKENQLKYKKDDWVEISEAEALAQSSREPDFEKAKFFKKNQIFNDFSDELNKPLEYNGEIFKIKEKDLNFYDTLFNTGTPTIEFITADNKIIALTINDWDNIKTQFCERKSDLTLKHRRLKDEIEATENKAQLKEIKWQ